MEFTIIISISNYITNILQCIMTKSKDIWDNTNENISNNDDNTNENSNNNNDNTNENSSNNDNTNENSNNNDDSTNENSNNNNDSTNENSNNNDNSTNIHTLFTRVITVVNAATSGIYTLLYIYI